MSIFSKIGKFAAALFVGIAMTATAADDIYPPLDTDLNDFDPTVPVGRYIQQISSNTVNEVVILTNGVLTVGGESINIAEETNEVYKSAVAYVDGATNEIGSIIRPLQVIPELIPDQTSPSNQLADKAWVDEKVESVAAYYITADAEGNAFESYAALANTTVYYSGGVVRVPTRNDYAVVLADETHGGTEWRYIYAVPDGASSGQWEAQYPIETNDYEALSNKPEINGHTLTNNQTGADLGLLDLAGGTMTGEFRVGATFDGNFQVVPEKTTEDDYIPPTMRFSDGAGVVGIIWRIVDGVVVMDVSDVLGTTYRIAWPSASGTLALAAPNPTAGNIAVLDPAGNPTDSGLSKDDVEGLFFAMYYPEGNVKSAAEFTPNIKYTLTSNATERTAMVKPFCNTGDSANDNSDLVGRVVIPPFVDAQGNGYISDNGTRFEVVGVGSSSAFYDNTRLVAVIVPRTVATIGGYAFRDCTALTSVSLPAVQTVGDQAFARCSSLTAISLPAAMNIGDYVFTDCASLTSVSLPAATTVGNAFWGCGALTSVSLPAATNIGDSAFSSCAVLASVVLPAATTVGNAFRDCTALTSVVLPAATSFGNSTFLDCTSLASVDFGDMPRPSVPDFVPTAFDGVPTSCKLIVPDDQYDEWTAKRGWSALVRAGYTFLRHSEWEYARKYEVDRLWDRSTNSFLKAEWETSSGEMLYRLDQNPYSGSIDWRWRWSDGTNWAHSAARFYPWSLEYRDEDYIDLDAGENAGLWIGADSYGDNNITGGGYIGYRKGFVALRGSGYDDEIYFPTGVGGGRDNVFAITKDIDRATNKLWNACTNTFLPLNLQSGATIITLPYDDNVKSSLEIKDSKYPPAIKLFSQDDDDNYIMEIARTDIDFASDSVIYISSERLVFPNVLTAGSHWASLDDWMKLKQDLLPYPTNAIPQSAVSELETDLDSKVAGERCTTSGTWCVNDGIMGTDIIFSTGAFSESTTPNNNINNGSYITFNPSYFGMSNYETIQKFTVRARSNSGGGWPGNFVGYARILNAADLNTVLAVSEQFTVSNFNQIVEIGLKPHVLLDTNNTYMIQFVTSLDSQTLAENVPLRLVTGSTSPLCYVNGNTSWKPIMTVDHFMSISGQMQAIVAALQSGNFNTIQGIADTMTAMSASVGVSASQQSPNRFASSSSSTGSGSTTLRVGTNANLQGN